MMYLDLPRRRYALQTRDRKTNAVALHLTHSDFQGVAQKIELDNYSPGPKFFSQSGNAILFFDDSADVLKTDRQMQRHFYARNWDSTSKTLLVEPTSTSLDVKAGKIAYFQEGSVKVANESGSLLFMHRMESPVEGALALSPDGNLLAVASFKVPDPKTVAVNLFDLSKGELTKTLMVKDDGAYDSNAVRVLRITPDNSKLLIAGINQNFFLLDIATGTNEAERYHPQQQDHTGRIHTHHNWYHYMDLDVSPDGTKMLLLTAHSRCFLCDLTKGERTHIFHMKAHGKAQKTARFTKADGSEFIYADSFGQLEVIDVATRTAYTEPVFDNAAQIEDTYKASFKAAEEDDWDLAISLLEKTYDMLPEPKGEYPDVYNMVLGLIETYFRLGRYEEAWTWCEVFYDCGKSRYDTGEREVKSGKVAYEMGKQEEALAFFKKAYKKSKRCFRSNEKVYKDFFLKHK